MNGKQLICLQWVRDRQTLALGESTPESILVMIMTVALSRLLVRKLEFCVEAAILSPGVGTMREP